MHAHATPKDQPKPDLPEERDSRTPASEDHEEEVLDEALDESFPASDPIAIP